MISNYVAWMKRSGIRERFCVNKIIYSPQSGPLAECADREIPANNGRSAQTKTAPEGAAFD